MKLKIELYLFLLFFMPLLFISCSKEDNNIEELAANELLTNGNLEIGSGGPLGWFRSTPCPDTRMVWTEEEAFSHLRSLKMSNSTLESQCFSFWGQNINTNIPTGKSLTLRVRIKGQLEGEGVSIAIRGDDTPEISGTGEQFATTQGFSPISGTFDWTVYSLNLGTVEPTIESLTVYLTYLPNTTGTVFFDDVSLGFE